MNILLTADEAAGLQVLRLLLKSPHRICGVITPEENRPIRELALKNHLDMPAPARLSDPTFAEWIRRKNVDVLLNVHLLRIIQPAILEAVHFGAFNLHPGPLPDYAGLHTPGWSLYHREKEFAVTLHWMDNGVDTGPVVYQAPLPVRPRDTALVLGVRCASAGVKLVLRLLEVLNDPSPDVPSLPQDPSRRRYFGREEKPLDGWIDWKCSAAEIDALMRAYTYTPYPSPWGFPKTDLNGKPVEIRLLEVLPKESRSDPGRVVSATGDEAVVASADRLLRIGRCGVNGYPVAPGKLFQAGDLLHFPSTLLPRSVYG